MRILNDGSVEEYGGKVLQLPFLVTPAFSAAVEGFSARFAW